MGMGFVWMYVWEVPEEGARSEKGAETQGGWVGDNGKALLKSDTLIL